MVLGCLSHACPTSRNAVPWKAPTQTFAGHPTALDRLASRSSNETMRGGFLSSRICQVCRTCFRRIVPGLHPSHFCPSLGKPALPLQEGSTSTSAVGLSHVRATTLSGYEFNVLQLVPSLCATPRLSASVTRAHRFRGILLPDGYLQPK